MRLRTMQFVAVLVLVACYTDLAAAQNKVVCYFGSWAGYRQGNGKFTVENIDPNLCTHLIYSFVGIDASGGIRILDSWNDVDQNGFAKFNALKTQNPSVKTLVAIGGWNEGSATFSIVMSNPNTRAAFINNAIDFVKKHNFDGFDLDWEYPGQRDGSSPSDKENFGLLLKDMRPKFDENGLLLTAAVAASSASVQISYDVPALNQYLDFINVMTYDLHGSWESVTGHNAPLFASSIDKERNLENSINFWISQGADPSKLVLGMGTYGRSFTLTSGSRSLGSPASGAGPKGPYTQEAGMLGYNEICEQQLSGGWEVSWDDEQQVPYASNGNVWVGYDDVRSIRAKSEFALSKGLGGIMIWSLETDDFLGLCSGKKFPLLSTIHEVLIGSGSYGADTIAKQNTQAASAPAAASSGATSSDLCTKEGYIRDPNDCQIFYFCHQVSGSFTQFKHTCPSGTAFDPINGCNHLDQVQC